MPKKVLRRGGDALQSARGETHRNTSYGPAAASCRICCPGNQRGWRYVDNAVLWGHGLVLNQGEFVEGFSSPLWMLLLLALRDLAARLDIIEYATFWNLQRAVAVACFGWFWWLCIGVNRSLTP